MMIKKLTLISGIAALLVGTAASAQPQYTMGNRPVMISTNDGNDPCVFSRIADMGEGAVMVFPGDSTDLDVVDYLGTGEPIWVCDGDATGDMVGIVYTNDPDQDCEVSSPVDEDRSYVGPCKWGWIKLEWVEMVAG